VKASPLDWGETLDVEALRAGSFLSMAEVKSDDWQR
jgi:hypothetical protein